MSRVAVRPEDMLDLEHMLLLRERLRGLPMPETVEGVRSRADALNAVVVCLFILGYGEWRFDHLGEGDYVGPAEFERNHAYWIELAGIGLERIATGEHLEDELSASDLYVVRRIIRSSQTKESADV